MADVRSTHVQPVTWREDGYPCFVREPWHKETWDKTDDEWRAVFIDRYTYLQEEYGDEDPDLTDIQCAIMGGA